MERPVDVWFQGIEAISECDMEPRGDWMEDIYDVMYPADARWFKNPVVHGLLHSVRSRGGVYLDGKQLQQFWKRQLSSGALGKLS